MIARGFKPVGWVAAVAGAALGCYMLSLNVAAERAELAGIERRIIAAKQDIRSLQTELGTRGRLTQLEHWNAEVLALSAPAPGQFVQSEFTLARFNAPQPSLDDKAEVRMAAADVEAVASQAQPKVAVARSFAGQQDIVASREPLVRRASLVVTDQGPFGRETAARSAKQPVAAKVPEAAPIKAGVARPATPIASDASAGGAGGQ